MNGTRLRAQKAVSSKGNMTKGKKGIYEDEAGACRAGEVN